jgi:BirA family biotin operon repressor/biotin-[acetyl-CoA-carboxylase] ligase
MSLAEALDAHALQFALGDQLIGKRVVTLEEATSTNDVVAQLAPNSGEGLVVIAERQTAGRGQYGRRWESAAGRGLWLSVLLRPDIPIGDSSKLTDLLALAVAETINENLHLAASIKPPNDVYIGGRKVAGVLVEMRVESDGRYCAIAGIGINVNHSPDDFPSELRESAGSLAIGAGAPVDRAGFLIALLRTLEHDYAAFRQQRS